MNDDYLFEGKGPQDPTVARLEERLARFRRPSSPKLPVLPPRRRFGLWRFALAAAVLLGATLALTQRAPVAYTPTPTARTPYQVEALEGRVSIVDALGRDLGLRADEVALPPGTAVRVPRNSRALVSVTGVGSVVLEEESELRVDADVAQTDAAGYLVHLDRGTLRATIFAAPRLFQIGTPSGIAVDLGCIYTATVRDDGSTLLRVETGAVSFEAVGRRVHVPADAECVAAPGKGPSAPVWSDDPAELRNAVLALDADTNAGAERVESIFRNAEPRATLSLFHLLDHPSEGVRRAALARIEALAPEAGPFDLEGDAEARDALRHRLGW